MSFADRNLPVDDERPLFGVEPWAVRAEGVNLGALGVEESVFALANGHIGVRGTLDEGEPEGQPGTYLNGFFEERPLPHAEAGYGFPESGQTVVNVTDGTLIGGTTRSRRVHRRPIRPVGQRTAGASPAVGSPGGGGAGRPAAGATGRPPGPAGSPRPPDPWRTIHGEECSEYWPAGTASFHIGADIADATARYIAATGDLDFEAGCGAELLVETARLWMSLGQFDGDDFRIDGVTGPDEYTAVVDDNTYTNLMAQRNLREAAAATERHPDVGAHLGVIPEEITGWRRAADAVVVPYDDKLGVHAQSEGFTQHAEWDFEATPEDHHPLFLHYPYFELYRTQVITQADLVLAMHLRGDAFTAEQKTRNFAYYEARTVRDSSLSACPQAVIAAEVGHLDLAYDNWAETAQIDLHNLHRNTSSGLHIAALAGAWTVAVAGFGGMRDHNGHLTFAPRLPPALSGLRFRLLFRDRCLVVDIEQREARYQLRFGDPLKTSHHGEAITVTAETPVTRPVPPAAPVEAVTQPASRSPRHRRSVSSPRPRGRRTKT